MKSTQLTADIEIGTGPKRDAQLILPSARDESMKNRMEMKSSRRIKISKAQGI